jgi:hypothetical protein
VLNQRLLRGQQAQIRWAYYVAAGVEGFTLLQQPPPKASPFVRTKWTLSARIVGSDAFKMAQRPLLFVTTVKEKRWLFQIEEFRIAGDRLTATLGPREDY